MNVGITQYPRRGRRQPVGYALDEIFDQYAPDQYPSGTGPAALTYAPEYRRMLAGLGDISTVQMDGPGTRYETLKQNGRRLGIDYPEELEQLDKAEDTQGNGIFDPANSYPNIHTDAGVFADHANLPGYLAREQFFAPSEVLDINTGRPVVYVPGNAFMLDRRLNGALAEQALYEPGWPGTGGHHPRTRSIVEPDEAAWPVGATDNPNEPAPAGNMFVMAALAGLAVGLVAGLVVK